MLEKYKTVVRSFFFKLSLGLAALVVLNPAPVQGADLYAILVCDTLAENVGGIVEKNYELVSREARTIAFYTGLRYKEISFKGEAVTENFVQVVGDLEIKPDDIIIFYFSGHGYRTFGKDQENPWPNFHLSQEEVGVDHYMITRALMEKSPRFLISLASTCNNYIPEEQAPPVMRKAFAFEPYNPRKEENYKKLFLEQNGTLMLSSSQPGQYAWGYSDGEIYTIALLKHIHKEVDTAEEADWHVILDGAAYEVHDEQDPQYLFIRESSTAAASRT